MEKNEKMSNVISIEKQCIICGKMFDVIIDKENGEIITNCFHNYLRSHIFLGWTYEFRGGKTIFNRNVEDGFKIRFKNNYYRVVGFCKWSRDIYYYVWKLFHRGKVEYWECPRCSNREDD